MKKIINIQKFKKKINFNKKFYVYKYLKKLQKSHLNEIIKFYNK